MNSSKQCFIALGSNLGDPKKHLQEAIDEFRENTLFDHLLISKFYTSKPHGPQDQADYINAAVYFETTLDAEPLLDFLQNIETRQGRDRKNAKRWGARTLDLDILFYNDETIETQRLSVPHPRICERAFVLLPLKDLTTQLNIDLNYNQTTSIQDCIDQLTQSELNNIQEIKLCQSE